MFCCVLCFVETTRIVNEFLGQRWMVKKKKQTNKQKKKKEKKERKKKRQNEKIKKKERKKSKEKKGRSTNHICAIFSKKV